MKRTIAVFLLLSFLFAGCGKKRETDPVPFPDLTLEAEAEDMAVWDGSLFWCAGGKVYRLDPPEENEAQPGEGTLFFDGFPAALLSSDGERLAVGAADGTLLVGIPGEDGMKKTKSADLPVPEGCEASRLALAGNTAVFCWRETENGSERMGFYNLENGDFFEDTPSGEGRCLIAEGGPGHVFVCRPDSLYDPTQLYGFDVIAMKRGAVFPADGILGLSVIGWNAADGCLYALDGYTNRERLYCWETSGPVSGEKMIPADAVRNRPEKLLFLDGAAVVLHGSGGEITVCRDFRGTEEDVTVTVTVLIPDDMDCDLDRLSSALMREHGIRLVLKKMKPEAIETKLLARDDDYDLWLGTGSLLNLSYPVWEPLEDYPLIAEQTELLFDDIVRICTVDGHLFGLPYSMQLANCCMSWNAELAAELGIEKPKPGWTLDDFLALARELKSRGYYICGNAWPTTLHDYMWQYFDPYGTGRLNDDGEVLRRLLVWGKTLQDEELLYPDSIFGPKDRVLLSGPAAGNIVYSAGETVPDPTVDGTEIYSDSASFLLMNPLSKHKTEASAVVAAMIDPKNGLYTLPTALAYYYKDFSLYRWETLTDSDREFLEAAADEEDRAEREALIRGRGSRMMEAEKEAGTYTDIWNMDEKTRDNYELYLHILSKFKLGRNYTKDWLLFALEECNRYLASEQDLEYTVKRILDRAKMVMEG